MTRSQSSDVYKQGSANSKQNQANAQTALGNVGTDLGDYSRSVNEFIGADPYKAGGEFQTTQRTIAANRANATSNALRDQLQLDATRTGSNTAGYAPALASATRQATLDQSQADAQAEADRLNKETAYSAEGVKMKEFPVETERGVYSTSLGGANTALSTAGSAAAANRSFGDVFGQAFGETLGKDAANAAVYGNA